MRSATTSEAAVGRGLEEHEELLAGEPRRGVALAHERREPFRRQPQQLIAARVAVAVVDLLEAVEVDVERRARVVVAPRPREHLLGAVDGQDPVGKAGHLVVEGLVAQTIVERDEMLQALVALAREQRHEPEQEQRRERGHGGVLHLLRREQPHPRRRGVHELDPYSLACWRRVAPRAIAKRIAETPKPTANCASSAAISSPAPAAAGAVCASAKTTAGLTANHEFDIAGTRRPGWGVAAQHVRGARHDPGGEHGERDDRHRDREQERHEGELRGHRVAELACRSARAARRRGAARRRSPAAR